MKDYLLFILLLFTHLFSQGTLEVGIKASGWELKDADGKIFTMGSWTGKILQINYVDPDESEMNEHFNDAVKYAIDVDSLIARDSFKGIGIADCASSWKPDFAIRLIGGAKAKKYDTTVLFDYDGDLRKAWGLKEDSYNVIILDEDRIVRAIIRGQIPEEQVADLVQLIINLQNK